jgi:hypothetical protein
MLLAFLNGFFFVFHTAVIVFTLFGWAFRRTRKANLAVILLIAFSWFVLGIRYGYGYCPCTDWHWRVREELGYVDLPSSYTKFLLDRATGWNVDPRVVDVLTLALLVAAFAASLALNLRDRRERRRARGAPLA